MIMADKKEIGKSKKNPTAHLLYEISGTNIKRKNRECPKCGKGSFMAKHSNRLTCGKCNYTEFESKHADQKR